MKVINTLIRNKLHIIFLTVVLLGLATHAHSFVWLNDGKSIVDSHEDEIPNWYQEYAFEDGRYVQVLPAEYKVLKVTEIVEAAKVVTKKIPAVTKQVTRRVVKSPSMVLEKQIPAQTAVIQKKVVVQPATVTRRIVPAVIENVGAVDPKTGRKYIREVVVNPEYEELITIPAVMQTVNETVVVADARTEQVQVPAVFETVTEEVVVTPAYNESISVPAIVREVEKPIMIIPARMALMSKSGEILHIFTSQTEFLVFLRDPNTPNFTLNPSPFRQVVDSIVIQPSQTEYRIVPAKTEVLTETVVVQQSSSELVSIPASYRTITETVVVQEQTTKLVTVPAQFETHKESVMIAPAQNGQPAKMRTINVRKLIRPAVTREVIVPAVTKQVTRRVVDRPASTQERAVPAKTSTSTKRVVSAPERVVSRDIPQQEISVQRLDFTNNEYTYEGLRQEKFVWPSTNTLTMFTPPQTDMKMDIPYEVCAYRADGMQASLMDVQDNLSALLNKHRYQNRVYQYPNGFALLTMPERITETAETIFDSKSNRRIKLDQHPIDSVASYLDILFTKPETRYRYIAFIISAMDNIESSGNVATPEELKAVFAEGGLASDLPQSFREYAFTRQYKCQAWIYEFSRIDREDPVSLEGDLFVPATPSLSEFLHKTGSPVLQTLFNTQLQGE